jgi:hypothetical protein
MDKLAALRRNRRAALAAPLALAGCLLPSGAGAQTATPAGATAQTSRTATPEERAALAGALRSRGRAELDARMRALEMCRADPDNQLATCRMWADRASDRIALPGDAAIARWDLIEIDWSDPVDEAALAAMRRERETCSDLMPGVCELRAQWVGRAARAQTGANLVLDPVYRIGPSPGGGLGSIFAVAPRQPESQTVTTPAMAPTPAPAPAPASRRCERVSGADTIRDPARLETTTTASYSVTCGTDEAAREQAREALRRAFGRD